MIHVLIVDDDHLVRKGLLFAMPWSDFEMKVIGEASNGKKALEFIENNSVDLIITDINMPVMSGIELMREVKQRYLSIHLVVLTLHQDFEYIQEALRLGVIDFIKKVELETGKFDQVLERIYNRITDKHKEISQGSTEALFTTDSGCAMFFRDEEDLKDLLKDIQEQNVCYLQQVDQNFWFCISHSDQSDIAKQLSLKFKEAPGIFIVEVNHIKGEFLNRIFRIFDTMSRKWTQRIGRFQSNPTALCLLSSL
ncbi:response regulator [Salipaludibacillus sp. HK11]|uniref:response regulator n=1 Tax=Salipaludibacillus sp. HK11 TaxID=3394320 RepID=UPI0039FDC1AF